MLLQNKGKKLLLSILIVFVGILPIILYETLIGSPPNITPGEAVELLDKPGANAILVDIRSSGEFKGNHIDGSLNWPYDKIMALSSLNDLPEQFAGKQLILLCKSGITSALAVRKLQKMGAANISNVRGGAEAWVANLKKPFKPGFYKIIKNSGEIKHFTSRDMPLFKELVVIGYGLVIKPLYMLLSLLLIIILWKARSFDLKTLKWGLVFFLAGETACWVNYFVFRDTSFLSEYLHSFGMVLSFAFVTFALFEGIDRRIIKYSDIEQKCAAIGLCRACFKYTEAPCGLKRFFLFLTLACIILAFIPLTGVPHWGSYNTTVVGTPYDFSHPVIYQLFEIRFCPYIAIVLFVITLIILLVKKVDPVTYAKVFFSGGIGYLSFGTLRFFLIASYRDNLLWYELWEEATELLFVVGVGITLWLFRHKLFKKEAASRA
ncbi:MAG: rhodanese-like domain-containing protein [Candidatus Aminicenantes bacterium]|nr:rhodanese-like domain-containing protein [Candidatus Aminicenantes bacterium]